MQDIRIGILGALGKMGRKNSQAVLDKKGLVLTAICDKAGNESTSDYGHLLDRGTLDLFIDTSFQKCAESCDVIIDFSHPSATIPCLLEAVKHRASMVIGTTGFSDKEEREIQLAAKKIPIVKSGNFSTGINLLMGLVEKAATVLGKDYNIEIVEQHHNQKVDAPSGTALMLAQMACEKRGLKYPEAINHHRKGQVGRRPIDEIGLFSLRGGGVIGQHDVYLMGEHEKIYLGHIALSRNAFSNGVVIAAEWIRHQQPGLYSMLDVLKIV